MRRGLSILVTGLLAAAVVAGCGGGSKHSGSGGVAAGSVGSAGGGNCQAADKALIAAARAHVAPLKVGPAGVAGDVARITVDVCRTDDADAHAVVVVYGMHDKSMHDVRDVRHQLRLIKVGGLWQVTDDLDTHTCQKGHGHQDFSGDLCS